MKDLNKFTVKSNYKNKFAINIKSNHKSIPNNVKHYDKNTCVMYTNNYIPDNYLNLIKITKKLKKIISNINIIIMLLSNVFYDKHGLNGLFEDTKKIYDRICNDYSICHENVIICALIKYKNGATCAYKQNDEPCIVSEFININRKQEELYQILNLYCEIY